MTIDLTEPRSVNKPAPFRPRPLADLVGEALKDAFGRQGFAKAELVTRWAEIVGADIAAHCAPQRLQWPRPVEGEPPEPATLVLRVEGPTAIEVQHLSNVILERVNRFFGWQAVGRLALRQAPLAREQRAPAPAPPSAEETARIAEGFTEIGSGDLRDALARLGAAVKRT